MVHINLLLNSRNINYLASKNVLGKNVLGNYVIAKEKLEINDSKSFEGA